MNRLSEMLTLELLAHEYTLWKHDRGTQMRFGQRIWNLYGSPGVAWPELYYEEDELEVYSVLSAEIYGMIQEKVN